MNLNKIKYFLFSIILITLVFNACSPQKSIQKQIYSGNYEGAIKKSIKHLKKDKRSKRNQPYILLLEEAFAKATDRDLRKIQTLEAERNPAFLEDIYLLYKDIQNRQESIRPLLPLFITEQNRDAQFNLKDYSPRIRLYRNSMSEFFYQQAIDLLESRGAPKQKYKKAYNNLEYIRKENPNYKDSEQIMNELWLNGATFVHIYTRNDTRMTIPKRLEQDLLNFSTWGLNNKWIVYHNHKVKELDYDEAIIISFREIQVSPEQMKEKQFSTERIIKTGTKVLKDSNGKEVKDSNGNVIKEDITKKVKASIIEFRQFKTCRVIAIVQHIDLRNRQTIETYPLEGAFTFENIFARYQGNIEAIEDNYKKFLKGRSMPYPSSEQMIYDCGESLKAKLKDIIISINRRR